MCAMHVNWEVVTWSIQGQFCESSLITFAGSLWGLFALPCQYSHVALEQSCNPLRWPGTCQDLACCQWRILERVPTGHPRGISLRHGDEMQVSAIMCDPDQPASTVTIYRYLQQVTSSQIQKQDMLRLCEEPAKAIEHRGGDTTSVATDSALSKEDMMVWSVNGVECGAAFDAYAFTTP